MTSAFSFADLREASCALATALRGKHVDPVALADLDDDAFVRAVAETAGFVAERVELLDDDLDDLLRSGLPAVIVPAGRHSFAHAIAPSSGRAIRLIDPSGVQTTVPRSALRGRFIDVGSERIGATVRALLGDGDDPRLGAALSEELRTSAHVASGYVFRPDVAASTSAMRASIRPGRTVGKMVVLSLIQSAIVLLSWWAIGSLAIDGHAARGTLLGWALLSATAIVVQLVVTRLVGDFTVRAATTLRQRLLEGAFRLSAESLGDYGLGGLMVLASQADSFLGALIVLIVSFLGAMTNLLSALVVLSIAPLPAMTTTVLVLFVVAAATCLPFLARSAAAIQARRMSLTTDVIERMVGHRTRLVQQPRDDWHAAEDEPIADYAKASRGRDRSENWLAAIPRAYHLVSVVVLLVSILAYPTPEVMAVALGGIILGMASLTMIVGLVRSAAELYALWQTIRPVIDDGPKPVSIDDAELEAPRAPPAGAVDSPLLELRGVRFAYPHRARPVLDDVSMRIDRGERVLVEGSSGGGKTTLTAILTGLRRPDAGLYLVHGMDQHTTSDASLRRTVAAAPQFYKNHVLSQSLAFNLLMGRRWPPSRADLREAMGVCRALGLGALLKRMPSGIFQFVGETGWQLSHGEKSRVYLARTLLQPSHVVVLDETLGALDPDSVRRCMRVVLGRAKTVVVITHR